jgi:hypothetical protein
MAKLQREVVKLHGEAVVPLIFVLADRLWLTDLLLLEGVEEEAADRHLFVVVHLTA